MSIAATVLLVAPFLGAPIANAGAVGQRFPMTVDARDYVSQFEGRWCTTASSLWVFDDMVVLGKRAFWAQYRLDLSPESHQEIVVDYQTPERASFRLRLDRDSGRLMRYRAWGSGYFEPMRRCAMQTAEVSQPPKGTTPR